MTMVTMTTAMQRHVSFVPLPLMACPLSCPTHPSLPRRIVSVLNAPPLFLCKSRPLRTPSSHGTIALCMAFRCPSASTISPVNPYVSYPATTQNQPLQKQDDSAKRADPAVHPRLTDQFINNQDANDSARNDDDEGFLSGSVTWPRIPERETNPLELTHLVPHLFVHPCSPGSKCAPLTCILSFPVLTCPSPSV